MEILLRVFQVFLALGLIGVVLLQRSEGGGLGIGSSGGMGSFMSVRGTANFLTRLTAILAGLFMIVCLILALLAKPATNAPKSIFDTPAPVPLTQAPAPVTPVEAPAPSPAAIAPAPAPVAPAAPAPAPAANTTTKAPQTGTAPKSGQ
jgi:preprotein translocase subunit SecG